jgi:hypothetical protein
MPAQPLPPFLDLLQAIAACVLVAELLFCVWVGAGVLFERFPHGAPRMLLVALAAAVLLASLSGCVALQYSAAGCRDRLPSMLDQAHNRRCAELSARMEPGHVQR